MGLVILDDLPELEIAKGIRMRAVTAVSMTVAHVQIDAGSPLPEHSHPNEQVVNVMEGELEIIVAGRAHKLTRGKVLIIPPNALHSGLAISDCLVIDVFYPVREDFKGAGFAGYPKR